MAPGRPGARSGRVARGRRVGRVAGSARSPGRRDRLGGGGIPPENPRRARCPRRTRCAGRPGCPRRAEVRMPGWPVAPAARLVPRTLRRGARRRGHRQLSQPGPLSSLGAPPRSARRPARGARRRMCYNVSTYVEAVSSEVTSVLKRGPWRWPESLPTGFLAATVLAWPRLTRSPAPHDTDRTGGAVADTPVSLREVAALAGVSLGTVSNVLDRPEVVAEPTGPGSRRPSSSWVSSGTSRPASSGPAGAAPSGWSSWMWRTRSSPTWRGAWRTRRARPGWP